MNLAVGFTFADTPCTGVSFQVIGTDPQRAELLLDRMEGLAIEVKNAGKIVDEPIEVVIERLREEPVDGLVEPSDNIGAGAPSDCTGLLRVLLERDIPNSAVSINDPETVQRPLAGDRKVLIGGKAAASTKAQSNSKSSCFRRATGGSNWKTSKVTSPRFPENFSTWDCAPWFGMVASPSY